MKNVKLSANTIVFGLPRTGKSTFASALASQWLKRGCRVYCSTNLQIKGTYSITKEQIGKYDLGGTKDKPTLVIYDECGVDFDNRQFKTNMPTDRLDFIKTCGHRYIYIVWLSQSYEDCDLKIRNCCERYYLVERSIIPFHSRIYEVIKKLRPDDTTGQFVDVFTLKKHPFRIFRPRYYKLFDSYICSELPLLESKKY